MSYICSLWRQKVGTNWKIEQKNTERERERDHQARSTWQWQRSNLDRPLTAALWRSISHTIYFNLACALLHRNTKYASSSSFSLALFFFLLPHSFAISFGWVGVVCRHCCPTFFARVSISSAFVCVRTITSKPSSHWDTYSNNFFFCHRKRQGNCMKNLQAAWMWDNVTTTTTTTAKRPDQILFWWWWKIEHCTHSICRLDYFRFLSFKKLVEAL